MRTVKIAVELLRSIAAFRGLAQGGDQSPNAEECLDAARALEADPPLVELGQVSGQPHIARQPDRQWFACAKCGAGIACDDAGCCASCGGNVSECAAWDCTEPPEPAIAPHKPPTADKLTTAHRNALVAQARLPSMTAADAVRLADRVMALEGLLEGARATEQQLRDQLRRADGAVAEFIDGHAKRLADSTDSDLPWDLLGGNHRTEWSAQVHDVLNHLRVIDNPDGEPEIVDGRAGGSYDRYLAERAQVRELTEEVRQLTEAHNERLDGLEAAALQPERVPGLTVQANPGPGRYVKGQDTKVTLVGEDGRALVLPTRKVTIVIDGRRGLAVATIEAPVARLDLRGLKPPRAVLPDDPAATCDLLGLVGVDLPPATVAAWTPEQRAQADAWAGAVHLHASDHDDVVPPPRPDFLPVVS